MRTTVIISSYEWPSALQLVLQTLAKQDSSVDQVIVADDGSSPSVAALVQSWSDSLPIELVWQADYSFRAARARNLAILRAKSEHLIFIDGDCLLPKEFVSSHKKLADKGRIVAGGRHHLSESQSQYLLKTPNVDNGVAFKSIKFLRIPLGFLRDLRRRAWHHVRTCNMSVMREDILAVGGFDESYKGWGREDSDIVVRMLRNGATVRSSRFLATVSHLWHGKSERARLVKNNRRFDYTLSSTNTLPKKSVCLNL